MGKHPLTLDYLLLALAFDHVVVSVRSLPIRPAYPVARFSFACWTLLIPKEFLLKPKRGSRQPAEYITDTDFADDISLISSSLENAQNLLLALEKTANCVGLYLNESKTEYMNNSQTQN